MMRRLDIERLKDAIRKGHVTWRKHVLVRLAQRNIKQEDVRTALRSGRIVREYLDDKPFASALFLAVCAGRPLHVVAAYDASREHAYIITAYEPSLDVFESDYTTRRHDG